MTAEQRAERTRWADELCTKAYDGTGVPETGVALVAVGGYGRGELATYSDLDVVLVLDDGVEPGRWAGDVWYPLWDSGAAIDHSVRTLSEMSTAAVGDVRVALGLLDARHLAGDPTITLRLRTALHNDWRKEARARLPQLREVVGDRVSVTGELAHAAVPDLKESTGGLRDATVLKALVASWLVDVPHTELEGARTRLLDVRDALHEVAGRATDRVAPEYWSDMAKVLGLEDDTTLQRSTRAAGRRITHLSRLTWSRAEAALSRPRTSAVRRPDLQRVATGVAVSRGEVVLQRDARVAADPMLLLRAAAEAAERGLVLSPTTSARLAREAPALPDPWPAEARDLLVRLLAAGPGLLPVWETLDETGAIDTFLPEWEQVRLLPHASVVHRWTVDRHLVQTCIEAAGLIRRARRPDVLMVAALLHDIGKGGLVEHSVAGEPIARRVATRMGFAAREVDLVGQLVRRHLLLPEVATTRDPDDPATLTQVTAVVPDREVLDLLATLTEADARATSDQAWTSWRAGRVHSLHRRAAASLTEGEDPVPEEEHDFEVPGKVRRDPRSVFVQVDDSDDGAQVTVISGDRVGLLADAAAMLALQRVSVRAARARVVDDVCLSVWQVADSGLDETVLLQRLENIVEGRLDARERLSRLTPARIEPTVAVRPEASDVSTVIEVRAEDRPGVLFTVCRALADAGVAVRSMHVTTLGPQAIDVFYVQETGAGALGDVRASAAAHAVRSGLLEAVSLETPGAGT